MMLMLSSSSSTPPTLSAMRHRRRSYAEEAMHMQLPGMMAAGMGMQGMQPWGGMVGGPSMPGMMGSATDPYYKTQPCPYFRMSLCSMGRGCYFAHSPEDLRPAPEAMMMGQFMGREKGGKKEKKKDKKEKKEKKERREDREEAPPAEDRNARRLEDVEPVQRRSSRSRRRQDGPEERRSRSTASEDNEYNDGAHGSAGRRAPSSDASRRRGQSPPQSQVKLRAASRSPSQSSWRRRCADSRSRGRDDDGVWANSGGRSVPPPSLQRPSRKNGSGGDRYDRGSGDEGGGRGPSTHGHGHRDHRSRSARRGSWSGGGSGDGALAGGGSPDRGVWAHGQRTPPQRQEETASGGNDARPRPARVELDDADF
eukprot:TRINITY_DN3731_c1_g2_i3.p1 TRINITY_DN3731_c1_g2~~TRINITY_DN3731_c1_g2_i3.p1  ORF type:complete len:367 (+),score=79.65 TRINITY_DN3731_c1_g2_i3:3-1103(+)